MFRYLFDWFKKRAVFWVAFVYLVGVVIRGVYTFVARPPEMSIFSDMKLYVHFARTLQAKGLLSLQPWDVTHPLGFSLLLSWILPKSGSHFAATLLQFAVSCLTPLAVGCLGAAAFGRMTAAVCVVLASLYFPFIEFGALYLTEIHFMFWMALGFAALLAATASSRRWRAILWALAGGFCLSVAVTMKALALPAGLAFFGVYGVGVVLRRSELTLKRRVETWLLIAFVALLGALPVTGSHTALCTNANRGNFCIAGNKSTADFLLGHCGKVGTIRWRGDSGHEFLFGSPGAHLRHYDGSVEVPFFVYDGPANSRAAWRWISAHPGQSIVLSLNHVYDSFLGVSVWPSYGLPTWAWADLFQLLFVGFLLFPTAMAFRRKSGFGWRALLCSRVFVVFSPVLGLIVTLLIATGEVRYRIPFDIFFMVVAGASWTGKLREPDPPAMGFVH
jgi:4-amino-4-deoxy-L-arabinose transferase-like glycosyltransferase